MPRRPKNTTPDEFQKFADVVGEMHREHGSDVSAEISDGRIKIEIRRPAAGKAEDIVHGAEKAAKAVGKLIRRGKKRNENSA